MYLILMVYACLISCSLINKSKCHSLAYFNIRWTCVVILHKGVYVLLPVVMMTSSLGVNSDPSVLLLKYDDT